MVKNDDFRIIGINLDWYLWRAAWIMILCTLLVELINWYPQLFHPLAKALINNVKTHIYINDDQVSTIAATMTGYVWFCAIALFASMATLVITYDFAKMKNKEIGPFYRCYIFFKKTIRKTV